MTGADALREGGAWLGSVRSWLQWNKKNGEKVTWGSNEVILPHVTVRDIEEIAAVAIATERNIQRNKSQNR